MLKVFGFIARLSNIAYALLFVAGCGYFGVNGVKERVTWEEPQTFPCDPKNFEGKRWVRVEGCEHVPDDAFVTWNRTTNVLTEAWLPIRPVGAEAVQPVVVHSETKARLAEIDGAKQGEAAVAMAPFVIKRLDSAPDEVATRFPAGTVFFEEPDDEKPPFIWPVICVLAAGFWLLVAVGNALPRKKKGEPDSSSPSVSTS